MTSYAEEMTDTIEFAGASPALIRETEVRESLSLGQAIDGLRQTLRTSADGELISLPRMRVVPRRKDRAWLHTLRAGAGGLGVAGGKDYGSLGFETPSLWVTVLSQRTGRLLALIEAEHLTRLRTAAVAAVATDALAPPSPETLAHFGVGKISEHLVRAMLEVRPSLRRVLVVRRREDVGPPEWLHALPAGVEARLSSAEEALASAEVVTTATSSKVPVIPGGAAMPRLRHLNLMGSNHRARREIDTDLAHRCASPRCLLVADDPAQAAVEAGDFQPPNSVVDWETVPSLERLVREPAVRSWRGEADLTAFESVGAGLMDLLIAAVLMEHLGLLPAPPERDGAR